KWRNSEMAKGEGANWRNGEGVKGEGQIDSVRHSPLTTRPRLDELWLAPQATAEGLTRLLRRPAPPHALLIVGVEGVGKRTLAHAFAAAWMCPNRTPEGHCGVCEVCRRWSDEGQHPDLRVLRPDPDQIKIDAVRETRQWMGFAPTVASFRFVILEEAHKLNPAAANALLKTLEEPPARYSLLLTATATDLLIPTIRSRCRIVRLATLPIEQLASRLQARFALEPDEAQLLAELAGGAPGRAIRWAQGMGAGEGRAARGELQQLQALLDLFAQIGQARLEDALRLAEQFRERCKHLETSTPDRSPRSALAMGLDYLLCWYRDSLVAELKGSPLQFQAHREPLCQLARRFPPAKRLQDMTSLVEARRAILRNANHQIITESLFIQLLSAE
ncbi:MAG: DNA polymerase III subunit delta', partial [Fimbriimonadales bacterium]|nr:DNA polymerase III subunit delta' [Fimbriimonadales bacterium]